MSAWALAIPGCSWKQPIANLFIRLKSADLHPTPFGAVSFIADGKLGLYHGAPTVILIFKDVRGISNPDLDCGIAGQNMVLAAHSMGLGTCLIGFAVSAMKEDPSIKRFIGIPDEETVYAVIALGYSTEKYRGLAGRRKPVVRVFEGKKQDTDLRR